MSTSMKEMIYTRAWVAAAAGNSFNLSVEINSAIAIGTQLDPLWCPPNRSSFSSFKNILVSAAAATSKECVEQLVPLVKLPRDATIYYGHDGPVALCAKRKRWKMLPYFLCKPLNPFYEAIRSRATSYPACEHAHENYLNEDLDPDLKVVETLRALEPLLDLVPEAHKILIMNEGLLIKAVQLSLYQTVKYLVDPKYGIDLTYCDPECAGGTYSCVDFAIRQEMPMKDFNIDYSITKLLWDATNGLRGTIGNSFSAKRVEKEWLCKHGILSAQNDTDSSANEVSANMKQSMAESEFEPYSPPNSKYSGNVPVSPEPHIHLQDNNYTLSPAVKSHRIVARPRQSENDQYDRMDTSIIVNDKVGTKKFSIDDWLESVLHSPQNTPNMARLLNALKLEGFCTRATLSLLSQDILDAQLEIRISGLPARLILAQASLLKEEIFALQNTKEFPKDVKSLVSWLDPDLDGADFSAFEGIIKEMFGGDVFIFNQAILNRIGAEDFETTKVSKLGQYLLIVSAGQDKI